LLHNRTTIAHNGVAVPLQEETTSPLIEALTVGARLGWLLDIAGKLLFSLGSGWLWLHIKERAEHEERIA
jgi:hypothetical protein